MRVVYRVPPAELRGFALGSTDAEVKMGRRRPSDSNTGVLLFVVLTIAVFLAALVPILWVLVEVWRLMTRKPVKGFVLTPEEISEAQEAWKLKTNGEELLTVCIRQGELEGCRVRADGYFDERRKLGRELNAERREAEEMMQHGGAMFELVVAQPAERWDAWAAPRLFAWAFRFCLASWAVSAVLKPDWVEAIVVELKTADAIAAIVPAGLAALPLLAAGATAGVVGWFFGLLVLGRRPSGEALFFEAASSLGTVTPPNDTDFEFASEENLSQTIGVMLLSPPLYVANTHGSISGEQYGALAQLYGSLPDSDAEIRDTALAMLRHAPRTQEAARVACEVLVEGSPNLVDPILQSCLVVLNEEDDAAQQRFSEVCTWLGTDVEVVMERIMG